MVNCQCYLAKTFSISRLRNRSELRSSVFHRSLSLLPRCIREPSAFLVPTTGPQPDYWLLPSLTVRYHMRPSDANIPPGTKQTCPIRSNGAFPLNAHLAANRGLELDHALRHPRRMRGDRFHECRLGCLLLGDRNSVEPLLQPRIVQPQRMSDRIHAVLPGQFHRSLPQRLRQPGPMRTATSELLQLALKLHNWFGNRR